MSQIQQVKDATNIVDIIGSRVSLQRSGSQFRGLCPFHSEKSPSFFVSETMQRYKCFGCGENGDSLEFLQKYEGMSFYEALSMLADQAGITLQTYRRTPEDELREQALEALDLAREYYHYLLTEHAVGKEAREYLKKRGISKESIKLFQLGYALDSWDGLVSFLHKKKKFSLKVLLAAGLIVTKAQRSYDRFRGRVMFPLKNHRGQVVGFSGRVVVDSKSAGAKYINTPETLLYHKSKLLFGYHELLQEIRKANEVVVVEGEFDVISSAQAHQNNIVAIKGSALTEDHAKLLSRIADTIILALDTDDAGIQATRKAIGVVQKNMTDSGKQLELRVVTIPTGKDPDEFIKSDPKGWRTAVSRAETAYDFLITAAVNSYPVSTPSGKRKIMADLAPVLSAISHEVELESYVRRLAEKLGVKPESVKADIESYKKRIAVGGKKTTSASSKSQNQPSKSYEEALQAGEEIRPRKETNREKLETYALFLALHSKEAKRSRFNTLFEIGLKLPGAQQLLEKISVKETNDLAVLRKQLPSDLDELLFSIYTHDAYFPLVDDLDIDAEWKTTLSKVKAFSTQAMIHDISKRLAQLDVKAELTPEEEREQQTLLKQVVALQASIKPQKQED